jgi:hypothetical protein
MPKYRVEIVEITTIRRETWIGADTEHEATEIALGQDWRGYSVLSHDVQTTIEFVEENDD